MVRGRATTGEDERVIVVVTGSRSLTRHPRRLEIKEAFLEKVRFQHPDLVFHGGASGPDTWAAFAFPDIQKRFDPRHTPARTPAQRLFDRNIEMIDTAILAADLTGGGVHVVACWDGVSSGTRHAMDHAELMEVPMTKVRFD